MQAPDRIAIVAPWDDDGDALACAEYAIGLAMRDIDVRRVPSLYTSGVRFRREHKRWRDVGEERFVLPSLVLLQGGGDCDDLVVWRCAELRLAGIDARAVLVRQSPTLDHLVVGLPDGTLEDPSATLGMYNPLREDGR